jgi:hypothetical protein
MMLVQLLILGSSLYMLPIVYKQKDRVGVFYIAIIIAFGIINLAMLLNEVQ